MVTGGAGKVFSMHKLMSRANAMIEKQRHIVSAYNSLTLIGWQWHHRKNILRLGVLGDAIIAIKWHAGGR
jgi:hypothetical protein